MSHEQWEAAVDDAIDYLVTEFEKPLYDAESLERVFWKSVSLRIKHQGDRRHATVRGPYRRAEIELGTLPGEETDPEAVAIEHDERDTLLEFRATLTDRERLVLDCQYGETPKKQGRVVVARKLGLPIGEVRKHERNTLSKLRRFSAILEAGTLCAHREPQLQALGTGELSAEVERLALLHLSHCTRCQLRHAVRLRAIRRGDFQREIANILPTPPLVEASRQRGWLEIMCDWASRPWSHEAASTGTQLGLASRGIGTIAAAKIAALCIGSVSLVGGGAYCLHAASIFGPEKPEPIAKEEPKAPVKRQRAEPPDLVLAKKLTVGSHTPTPTPTPKPKPRPKPKTQRQTKPKTPTSHEQESAVSAAPTGAAPNGDSEFGPSSANTPATKPAPPVASGGPEFP
ncbi:hypothetical protein OJ998_04970 [Solirubrobacter taibaiensis]|nr:hypothetical protein [Solirubrobacter taibaiensis]